MDDGGGKPIPSCSLTRWCAPHARDNSVFALAPHFRGWRELEPTPMSGQAKSSPRSPRVHDCSEVATLALRAEWYEQSWCSWLKIAPRSSAWVGGPVFLEVPSGTKDRSFASWPLSSL